MANKRYFVDVNLQTNDIVNLKADALDITSNLASANTKRIVYWSGQYYYSNGTSWIALGATGSLPAGGATGDILAKASGTDYDVEWISNYTSTVQHEVKLAENINKGQAVYVSSANGTNMLVSKASNATEATSSKTFGLLAFTGVTNDIGFVITEGLLAGLDTSTATAGDPVWLGTNGNLIYGLTNKPVAPAHLVFIGIVTRVQSVNGEIFVKVQNGYELGELHNVDALNPSNNDGLFYNTTSSLWEHKSIPTALGYTPENVANKSTSTSLGTSDTLYPTQNAVKVYADNLLGNANALIYKGVIDCSTNPNYPAADAGWLYIVSIAGKIGGTSGVDVEVGDMIICNTDATVSGNQATVGQYWNIIQKNIIGAVTGPSSSTNNNVVFFDGSTGKIIKDSGLTLSGTNTGDETQATIQSKLGLASVSSSGYLSSTDWNTFNNKQNALSGGTTNRITKWTSASAIGNSQIADDGTSLAIGASLNSTIQFGISTNKTTGFKSSSSSSIGINGLCTNATGGTGVKGESTGGYGLFGSSNSATIDNIGTYGIAQDSIGLNIGGKFVASGVSGSKYSVQLQDGTEGLNKFLKSSTIDGKANWTTLSVADTGLTLTTTGTSGAATLVGNTLNIPTYESSLIPKLNGTEIWRGSTFRNNSTTIDTTAGITLSTSGTNTARSVATTSYATKVIRMGVTASVVATGRYSGMRGSTLLWYVTGGFLYSGEFNISDTATAAGTHNFWGLASSTSDLVIGDVGNSQPSALTNIIAFANDSGDSNLQIMCNDATGTATKTDLGASFPSNRTAGAAITTIYSCFLYNAPNSSNVIYRIVNKETGAVAQGTLLSDLPASTVGLNFFGVRTMGTSGGGITNSGQFDVYRLGVYSL